MIKSNTLEIDRLPWIMGLKCNHKCPYKRKAEGGLNTEEGNRKKQRQFEDVMGLALKMKEGVLSQGMEEVQL